MSALRKSVFTEKVLKRLFPVSSGQDKGTPQTPVLETPPKDVTPEAVQHTHGPRLTDGDMKIQPERRLYTVSLPPPGYIPSLPEPASCADAETASSGGDTGEPDLHDQPKRKRIRKRKSKRHIKNLSDVVPKQAGLETQPALLQDTVHPPCAYTPTMTKNQRKKLKKKLQLRRKREAGLVTRAVGVTFTYQPESSSEADVDDRAGGGAEDDQRDQRGSGPTQEDTELASSEADVDDSVGGEAEDDQRGSGPTQEDTELASSKADAVLSFLKSTQEIYFYDETSKDTAPAVGVETAGELLHLLASRSMAPSDVLILDHMKTLLLLQDTERLQSALEMFPEHCLMPPDHARVITAFFNYWITHILPEKKTSE